MRYLRRRWLVHVFWRHGLTEHLFWTRRAAVKYANRVRSIHATPILHDRWL